jgi:hypothetical protein
VLGHGDVLVIPVLLLFVELVPLLDELRWILIELVSQLERLVVMVPVDEFATLVVAPVRLQQLVVRRQWLLEQLDGQPDEERQERVRLLKATHTAL